VLCHFSLAFCRGILNSRHRINLMATTTSSSSKRILAFDIGIKNLAWCCADVSPAGLKVRGWSNENLITGGTAESDKAANRCETCSHKAAYWSQAGKGYCSRHCPPLTPALRDLSGNLVRKLPPVAVLKGIAQKNGGEKKDLKTKDTAISFLHTRFCFPAAPAPKVKKIELEALHDSIQDLVLRNSEMWSGCTEILLENQPAFKNPVMKSIQMMLFATLRDYIEECPPLRLVHPGRKTAGATKGDEGYTERKGLSESKVLKGITDGKIQMDCVDGRRADWFSAQGKKSDLADCLCMVADAGGIQLPAKAALVKDSEAGLE
jgi:hypothetical protein